MSMRIKWNVIEGACGDVRAAAGSGLGCWVENLSGEVMAGKRPADFDETVRRSVWFAMDEVVTVCTAGRDRDRWCALLAKTVRRALEHQATVHDMAEATAKLWRQTNALLRMAASSALGAEPAAAADSILGTLSRATKLGCGGAVIRMPEDPTYAAYTDGSEIRLEPSMLAPLEEIKEDFLVVKKGQGKVAESCAFVIEDAEELVLARVVSDTQTLGFLIVPMPEGSDMTSEDIKLLGAAAQILAVAMENRFTLAKERDATRLQVENEMLSQQTRDMEEMVHVVSHDLRSPMTSMYGFMHLALDEIDGLRAELQDGGYGGAGGVADRISDPIENGVRSVEKLNRMVQRLLDFSRAARAAYSFERVDLGEVVTGVVRSLKHQIDRKGISIETVEMPTVTGDRVQLEGVFGNLVDNAVKYMGDSSERKIEIGTEQGSGRTVFTVADTGSGMTPDEVSKAFMPFRRFHSAAVPGEGIGLSHVRKIIERHNGRIWCESQKGVGTTFYFTLAGVVEARTKPDPKTGSVQTRARARQRASD